MRIALIVLAAAPFALTALPAQAQSRNGDPVASAAIFDGNFSQAEQQLSARLRLDPDQPELLLNLAAVYAQTGRTSQARALYIRVLQQRDVEMDLSADRVSTSHVVANKGLQYIRTLQLRRALSPLPVAWPCRSMAGGEAPAPPQSRRLFHFGGSDTAPQIVGGRSEPRQSHAALAHIFARPIGIAGLARLIALEEQELARTFVRIDLGGQRRRCSRIPR